MVAIDRPAILRYVEGRQALGAANGTINRELSLLGTRLRHAVHNSKLVRLPDLRKIKLREADPRAGFFEQPQFDAVRRRLPVDLQAAITVAYSYGWRMQSEVLSLDRRHLDLQAGTLTLDACMTKNGKARVVYLTDELRGLLRAQVERVRALERTLGRVIPHIFPHPPGPHTAPQLVGTRRQDFRRAWMTACKAARVPGRLRHDFRRTAAAQPDPLWCARACRDDDHGTSDALGVRPLQHRQRGRPTRGRAEDRAHRIVTGHVSGRVLE